MKLKLIISLTGILCLCSFSSKPSSCTNDKKQIKNWAIGLFISPGGAKLVLSPQSSIFYCPMQKQQMKWEESDTVTKIKNGEIIPIVNEKNELLKIATPPKGHFDSAMTECRSPAIRTKDGIVLMYNGKNGVKGGDTTYYTSTMAVPTQW